MRFRNALLFVALAVAWGSAFTAIKAGLEFFPPVLFAAFRYDLAGVLMLGYAAAIVVSLSPILTTGFARAFLPDERLTPVGILGLLVGFVGVVVLSQPDPNNLLDARTISLGLVFLAAASFALGSVLTRRIEAELPIETMEAWAMLLGAVVMHGASLGIGESPAAVRWTGEALLALGYLVVVASALGFLVYFDLLDRLGPIEINLVSYAAPVAAAVTGLLVLDERPTVATVAGFLLILLGFVLLKRRALRAEVARFTDRERRPDAESE